MINPEENCSDLRDYLDERFYEILRGALKGRELWDIHERLLLAVEAGLKSFDQTGFESKED